MPPTGSETPSASGRILLIDEDPKAGRFVRLSLSGTGCEVIASTRHAEGLRLTDRLPPDLVLMEARFGKTDSMALARQVLHKLDGRQAALAFLTQEQSAALRLEGLGLGAADYILKTRDSRRLGQRLRSVLEHVRGQVISAKDMGEAPMLVGMVRELEERKADGVLDLVFEEERARIVLAAGQVAMAQYRLLRGEAALNAIGRCTEWLATFHEGKKASDLSPLPPPKPGGSGPLLSRPPTEKPIAAPDSAGLQPVPAPEPALLHSISLDPSEVPTLVDRNAPARRRSPFDQVPATGAGAVAITVDPTYEVLVRGIDASSPTKQDYAAVQPLLDHARSDAAQPLDTAHPSSVRSVRAQTDSAPPPRTQTAPSAARAESPKLPSPTSEDPKGSIRPVKLPGGTTASEGPSVVQPGTARVLADEKALRLWLEKTAPVHVVLAFSEEPLVEALAEAVAVMGFSVVRCARGREALDEVLRLRPAALLCGLELPDMSGRALIASLRNDYLVRETPHLLLSGPDLVRQVAALGHTALQSIVLGLESCVGPRAALFQHLLDPAMCALPGRVDRLGVVTLLRVVGDSGRSGRLVLKGEGEQIAEVLFVHGQIAGVTLRSHELLSGVDGLFEVVGVKWRDYIFMPTGDDRPDPGDDLGDPVQALEVACVRNNELLRQIYHHGFFAGDGMVLDEETLDRYLSSLDTASLDLLLRIRAGEPPISLAEGGVAPPAQLCSLLLDLRLLGVVRVQPAAGLPSMAFDPSLGPLTGPDAPPTLEAKPRRRLWPLIVTLLGCAVLLALVLFTLFR